MDVQEVVYPDRDPWLIIALVAYSLWGLVTAGYCFYVWYTL